MRPASISAALVATSADGRFDVVDIAAVQRLLGDTSPGLPLTRRILVEDLAARAVAGTLAGGAFEREGAVAIGRSPGAMTFQPARTLLTDSNGIPALLDVASLRRVVMQSGGDPMAVDLALRADLVVDHSVRADHHGTADAEARNRAGEMERNRERYVFLRWAEQAFAGLRVVPPGKGICHQVNLEYLAEVARTSAVGLVRPDTVLGTDSHTTMINALGVLGWGAGGIDVISALIGRPITVGQPHVVGLRLAGAVAPGVQAADIVLTLTEQLRPQRLAGSFVEVFGPGVAKLSLPDRATVANMAPDFGATTCLFPVDDATFAYLRLTGRGPDARERIATALRGPAWLAGSVDPDRFDRVIDFDLSDVRPSISGPSRPDQRLRVGEAKASVVASRGASAGLAGDGRLVIAAITSCTNTSNPVAMITAGLVARAAERRGLRPPPWVKTSLAPGSRAVERHLQHTGLLRDLEAIGFGIVGFGCTSCCGNSGQLTDQGDAAVRSGARVAAVLSGNRNYARRIHPDVAANYLASPALVVAFALAGTMLTDLEREPVGHGDDGAPVFLPDLWPTPAEVEELVASCEPADFGDAYRGLWTGESEWQHVPRSYGTQYTWEESSTYLQPTAIETYRPRFDLSVRNAHVLLALGDDVDTDQVSPVGRILPGSAAAAWLRRRGVDEGNLDSFGARRGNPAVMVRGTFDHPDVNNALADGSKGPVSRHIPSGWIGPLHEVAARYGDQPTVILAGRRYGAGSSRDWAAKGVAALGVRAVVAASFERIHRSNLIGVGVLPLEFGGGSSWQGLGLDGTELMDIVPDKRDGDFLMCATSAAGAVREFRVRCAVATDAEMEVLRAGGVLPHVLQSLGTGSASDA